MSQISSSDLIPIELNFKVEAGPGAGKTHWLVNHVRHVLSGSNKLSGSRKIACITYTNAATQTIQSRIPHALQHVEVGTFHSFLYKFIIKPYLHFIASQYRIDLSKIDGYNDPFCKRNFTEEWLASKNIGNGLVHPYTTNQLLKRPENLEKLHNWLLSIKYELNGTDVNIVADPKKAFSQENGQYKFLNKKCITYLNNFLSDYKRVFFSNGILSHDDIIYLSFQILKHIPNLSKIVSIKFPYIYVDEFQDTHPIQAEIIRKLGISGSTVGVIGDLAQSIYEFNGATPENFSKFMLPNMQCFFISENSRSTPEIIKLLNSVRTNFKQISKNPNGATPILLIGKNPQDAMRYIAESNGGKHPKILSRTNKETNEIRFSINSENINLHTLWKNTDSDTNRQKIIRQLIISLESCNFLEFDEAVKSLSKLDSYKKKEIKSWPEIQILLKVYQQYNILSGRPVNDLLIIAQDFYKFPVPRKYEIINFYQTIQYSQIASNLDIKNDGDAITIHQSKGSEFDCVLLKIKDESDLGFILKPNLEKNEEHRIYYVAISRAKNYLYVWTPALSSSYAEKLERFFTLHQL